MLRFLLLVVLLPVLTQTETASEQACAKTNQLLISINEYNITDSSYSCNSCVGCARKCCADGFQVLLEERKCGKSDNKNFSIAVYKRDQAVSDHVDYFTGFLSCPSHILEPENYEEDVFFMQPDGRLWFKNLDVWRSSEDYCVDYVDSIGFTGFVCFMDEVTNEKYYRKFNEISEFSYQSY